MKRIALIIIGIIIVAACSGQEVLKRNLTIQKTTPVINLNGTGATLQFYNGDVSLTQSSNQLSLSGGNLSLGSNSLLMTGSLGATGSRLTKGWFINAEFTNLPTINGGTLATALSLSSYLAKTDTATMLTPYSLITEVSVITNDSIEARLTAAEEGVTATEYDAYTGNDDLLDLLQSLGGDVVALPFMRNNRMFPADFAMADGRAYYCVVQIRDTTEITGIKYVLSAQGVYTADNFNGVALYSVSDTTYTRVAVSADDGNIWKTAQYATGTKAFTAPYTAVPGVYYFAMIYNSSAQTTAPSIYACDPWQSASFLLGSSGNKIAGYVDAQTTLPASETAGDVTNYTNTPSIWFY